MRPNGILKCLGPVLLFVLGAILAVVEADNRMSELRLGARQGQAQVAEHRQSKWLIEKFKRPKAPKSHYGKPKPYFKAPKSQYGAPPAPQYSPPQENYYQNPTPYKSAYPTPAYNPPQLTSSPSPANYYANPSPYNAPPPAYRQPEASISPPQPEYPLQHPIAQYQQPHPETGNYNQQQQLPEPAPNANHFENPYNPPQVAYGQPEAAINPPQPEYPPQQQSYPETDNYNQQQSEPVPNPNDFENPYNPLQAAYRQPEAAINTPQPDYGRLQPANNPSQSEYNPQESSVPSQPAYNPQELPDPSLPAPQEGSKIPPPAETHNQVRPEYSPQQPFIQQPHPETSNNNYQPSSEPITESYREPVVNNPTRQPHTQAVNVVPHQQPYQNPVVPNKIPQQLYPKPANSIPPQQPYNIPSQPTSINNKPAQQPHTQVIGNIPSQQPYQEPINSKRPQHPHSQVNNIPSQQPYRKPVKNNPPQQPYTQAVSNIPQQQHSEVVSDDEPEEFNDYLQPAHTEAPQNPSETSTTSYNSYDSPENSPPASAEEQSFFSPPETASDYDDSPVNSPSLVPSKEPAVYSRPTFTEDVFSPPVEHTPIFYSDYKPAERVKSVKEDSDAGFFEFGIFPKSNSFFLQNYRG